MLEKIYLILIITGLYRIEYKKNKGAETSENISILFKK